MERRDFLELTVAWLLLLPAAGCRQSFSGPPRIPERCIHWYDLAGKLPRVLTEGHMQNASDYYYSIPDRGTFAVELPALVVYAADADPGVGFIEPYPFPASKLEEIKARITVLAQMPLVNDRKAIRALFEVLDPRKVLGASASGTIVTLHRKNVHHMPDVVAASRAAGLKRLCVIKDPALPPYLCDPGQNPAV